MRKQIKFSVHTECLSQAYNLNVNDFVLTGGGATPCPLTDWTSSGSVSTLKVDQTCMGEATGSPELFKMNLTSTKNSDNFVVVNVSIAPVN